MPAPRLGRLLLRWCMNCDLPVVESKVCSSCGSGTAAVSITPPGDMRPAFPGDIERVREVLDSQFGPGCGEAVIPPDRVVVLNRAPGDDVLDEVIVGGNVVGTFRYRPVERRFDMVPRMVAARAMQGIISRGFVVTDRSAPPFILKGASVLSPGVLEAHDDIVPMDEVVVLDPDGRAFACGPARMTGPEMVAATHGMAVRCRWKEEPRDHIDTTRPSGWEMAVEANTERMTKLDRKAGELIRSTVAHLDGMDMAVSYSGGKDSLASLLLVLEHSPVRPKMLFIDTGLEFPQTLENVELVRKRYDLELVTRSAGDAFWHGIEHFGPPGRDFRWCCKSCKLGPTSMLVREEFPQGVVSFIGQRGYESELRMKKGESWSNPWVADQKGVSPVQHWTALDVWLYIFKKKAPYNPLYREGMERIGCWLCPASNMAEFEIMSTHPDMPKLRAALEEHARKRGFTRQWVELGFWRFKKLPPGMEELRERKGLTLKEGEGDPPDAMVKVWMESEADEEGRITGSVSGTVDPVRLRQQVRVLGGSPPDGAGEGVVMNDCHVADLEVSCLTFGPDSVSLELSGKALEAYRSDHGLRVRVRKRLLELLRRCTDCVGCGVCVGRCPTGALTLDREGGMVEISDECTGCQECFGKCPVVEYDPR